MSSGPASKIMQLGIEQTVLAARAEGKGLDQITRACNDHLQGIGSADDPRRGTTVSKSTVKRYMANLAPGVVAAAHEPQLAAENARIAIDFAERLTALDETVRRWLDEADQAVTPMRGVLWNPYRQEPSDPKDAREDADAVLKHMGEMLDGMPAADKASIREWITPSDVLVPDWSARKVAASELRGLLKNYADLMQRIHDAEQVQVFQESVMQAIQEASPEVAAVVIAKMREKQSIRKAALLGA